MSGPAMEETELVEAGKPYVFSFTIDLRPEVELSSYDAVEIELPFAEATEAEIDDQVSAMAEHYTTFEDASAATKLKPENYADLAIKATDAEGNPVELTDEEKAAQLETLKTEQKALAEEVKAKLEGGATPEEIAEEYEDQLYSSALSRRSTGANAAASSYGEWLLDSARKAGDITLAENDTGSSVNYYVAIFEERLRDEENSRSVRHILFRAGSGNETPTQEQYDEAEQKAQDILDQWKAGEATEDSFAALASTSSEDTGSKSGGGLIDQITSNSPYMEPFRDWAVDPARQEGDTGLVKTDYGWHVMYYSSTDDPIWRLTVTDGLAQEDYDKLITDSTEGWSVTRGSGLGLLEA